MRDFGLWKKACAVFAVCAATASMATAQTFTTLDSFDGSDGAYPFYMTLVQGANGDLYGTTYGGGSEGAGTLFSITPAGALTTIYNFGSGAGPAAGVILADDGNFYGTTLNGGNGYGTIYKLTPNGVLTVLHEFDVSDGSYPRSPVVQAADGTFYGTTAYGGAYGEFCYDGCGTIFKITSEGVFTLLYSFESDSTGHPYSGLVQGLDRALYGTASGANNGPGTVFRITTSGDFSVLHNFCSESNCSDGENPIGGLALGTDGDFYGTTEHGGTNKNNIPSGTVFKLRPTGGLITVYNFCSASNCADGTAPYAGLIQGTDGSLYGTAIGPGSGLVFVVTGLGAESVLHVFCTQTGCPDGTEPVGGLVQATNGTFFGATYMGGVPNNEGTLYSLSTGLGAFVTFVRAAGKVGQTGGILGQGFTGTTSVSLKGIPASFTVVSDTYIRATVPAGAATGSVTVITPSGTLTSNVPFHVIK
jgi:uncharacterized repeat protein (TIGR03803 family)